MLDWIHRRMVCNTCGRECLAALTRQIFRDLSEHFLYVCPLCGKKGCLNHTQLYLPNVAIEKNLTPDQIKGLPVITPEGIGVCARCGKPGVQSHHWAPQAIFKDPWAWPMSDLCVGCHREWHTTLEAYYAAKFGLVGGTKEVII